MKTILGAVAAITILTASHFALAEEARGKVESMDDQTRTITLDDGSTYIVSDGVALEALQPGAEVTVSYEMKGTMREAMEIKPAK